MRRVALVVGLLSLSLGFFVEPALAHGDLIATSPSEGQTVGGALTTLQLVFSEPVEVEATELYDDGVLASAASRTSSPNVILIDVEAPLSEGLYRLTVRYLSLDGDTSEVSLSFNYLESAPEALSVVSVMPAALEEQSRRVWLYVIAAATLAVGAVVVSRRWLRVRQLERSR